MGRGEPIKILDLAKKFSDKIKFVELRKNEGLHTNCNFEETFKNIGWRANHSLFDYIEKIKKLEEKIASLEMKISNNS